MTSMEIRLFGPLSIVCDGQQIASLQGRKCRDLLSYLLLRHDMPHAREHLAELFWGHRDDQHARHCFNTALWRLQAALGGKAIPDRRWLRIDAQTVSFYPDAAVFVDVIDFERRCALADGWPAADVDRQAAMRRDAVAVYRGDLLADCYEEWCLADRERLQRLYVRALRRLVHYHRQRGEFDVAIDDARRILACDPLREEVHRDLISLYVDAEQPAAAMQQYRTCIDVLKRELGAAPMPETSRLLQRIMHAHHQEESPRSILATAPAAEEPADAPPAVNDSYLPGVELVLQVCRQLRDIATALESIAASLATPLTAATGGGSTPSLDHEHRQVLTEITTRLDPVAAALKLAATGGRARPRTVYIAPASEGRSQRRQLPAGLRR